MANHLVPGKVPKEQFDLLLSLTALRGKSLICALHLHLVDGAKAADACRLYRINPGSMSTKLKRLRGVSERVAELSCFYRKE